MSRGEERCREQYIAIQKYNRRYAVSDTSSDLSLKVVTEHLELSRRQERVGDYHVVYKGVYARHEGGHASYRVRLAAQEDCDDL